MKKIALITIILTFFSGALLSDETVVTKSGKMAILHSNGTWEYVKLSKDKNKAPKDGYSKPKESKKLLKGKSGLYGIWYNKATWKKLSQQLNEVAEISLIHSSNNAYAMVIAEGIQLKRETLVKIVMKNAKEAAPDAKIIKQEKRTVNGEEVILLHIEGTIEGIEFVYYEYVYSGKAGSIQFVAYTSNMLFGDYKNDFEDLLNGFVTFKKTKEK